MGGGVKTVWLRYRNWRGCAHAAQQGERSDQKHSCGARASHPRILKNYCARFRAFMVNKT
jgi:hypothetical protein